MRGAIATLNGNLISVLTHWGDSDMRHYKTGFYSLADYMGINAELWTAHDLERAEQYHPNIAKLIRENLLEKYD